MSKGIDTSPLDSQQSKSTTELKYEKNFVVIVNALLCCIGFVGISAEWSIKRCKCFKSNAFSWTGYPRKVPSAVGFRFAKAHRTIGRQVRLLSFRESAHRQSVNELVSQSVDELVS